MKINDRVHQLRIQFNVTPEITRYVYVYIIMGKEGCYLVMGRSFVTLEYQSTRAGSKGLFALDNLWDGLGALTVIKRSEEHTS